MSKVEEVQRIFEDQQYCDIVQVNKTCICISPVRQRMNIRNRLVVLRRRAGMTAATLLIMKFHLISQPLLIWRVCRYTYQVKQNFSDFGNLSSF